MHSPESGHPQLPDFNPNAGLPETKRPGVCSICLRPDCTDPSHRLETNEKREHVPGKRPYETRLEDEFQPRLKQTIKTGFKKERSDRFVHNEESVARFFKTGAPTQTQKATEGVLAWKTAAEGVERTSEGFPPVNEQTKMNVLPNGHVILFQDREVIRWTPGTNTYESITGWAEQTDHLRSTFIDEVTQAPDEGLFIETSIGTLWIQKDGSYTAFEMEGLRIQNNGKNMIGTRSGWLYRPGTDNETVENFTGPSNDKWSVNQPSAVPFGERGFVLDHTTREITILTSEEVARSTKDKPAEAKRYGIQKLTGPCRPSPMPDGSILLKSSDSGLLRLSLEGELFRIDPPDGLKILQAASAPDGSIWGIAQDAESTFSLLRFAPLENTEQEVQKEKLPLQKRF